ncbi:hypothetical protein NE237_026526 [Protea cynaroides]|uniref:Uncharacterized protein n=1 Tax=Protea cynaroides TaxID=273540 RepID=A0A9Q0H536_9MAGN|nr:hypothetical protein NE237_026526 [Protea cynaroides]
MTRASGLRDELKSFIQGYQEGVQELMKRRKILNFNSQKKPNEHQLDPCPLNGPSLGLSLRSSLTFCLPVIENSSIRGKSWYELTAGNLGMRSLHLFTLLLMMI